MQYPKISVWVTSCGRIQYLKPCLESFVKYCTYPNYELLIIESQMNDVSKQFYALEHIHEKETAEYLSTFQEKYPHVPCRIFIQEFKPLGQVYDQLLSMTEGYYLNLEDDNSTCCDPCGQLVDSITLLKNDPYLLAVRQELRDETIYEGCPRFPLFRAVGDHKYALVDTWISGGGQLVDADKARNIGGFLTSHSPERYGETEADQSEKMIRAQMYCGLCLKWWGWLVPIGTFGVRGGDRSGVLPHYTELIEYGWYGDGSNRRPKPHTVEYWRQFKKHNGLP